MKIKKYVTNRKHQTTIHGYTLTSDGMNEKSYILNGSVKSTNLAVNKVRSTIDPNFTSIDEPIINDVVTAIPIEVFNTIAINVDELKTTDISSFVNDAIDKLKQFANSNNIS